jgi:hypothetical protein
MPARIARALRRRVTQVPKPRGRFTTSDLLRETPALATLGTAVFRMHGIAVISRRVEELGDLSGVLGRERDSHVIRPAHER